jgi:hypothetical protein
MVPSTLHIPPSTPYLGGGCKGGGARARARARASVRWRVGVEGWGEGWRVQGGKLEWRVQDGAVGLG